MSRVCQPLGSAQLVVTREDVQAGDEPGDGAGTRETAPARQVPSPRQAGDAMPVPTGEPRDVGERCAAALSNHQVRMIAMDGRSARGCSLPRAARSPPEARHVA
jgi:hypothetical protein